MVKTSLHLRKEIAKVNQEARDSIIEKIQNLIAKNVGRGASQGEAENALRLAQRIMLEHNLSLAEVEGYEAKAENWVVRTVWRGKGRPWQLQYVTEVCMKFFFVRGMFYTEKGDQDLEFFGSEENVEIASQVLNYLNPLFRELWKQYRKKTGQRQGASRAYYRGLQMGLIEKLEIERDAIFKIEGSQSNGLIRIDSKLKEAFELEYEDQRIVPMRSRPERSHTAFDQGAVDGGNVELPEFTSHDKIGGTKALED